jgi:hypothetical protein
MAEASGSTGAGGGMQGFLKNLGKLPLVEKAIGAIAILVVFGWVAMGEGFFKILLFKSTFATLSFLGALAIAVIIILKLFEIRAIPKGMERYALAILALIPLVGLVLQSLSTVTGFLTMGGSLALAYISATSFWRKHLPTIEAEAESPPAAPQPPQPEEPPAAPPAP